MIMSLPGVVIELLFCILTDSSANVKILQTEAVSLISVDENTMCKLLPQHKPSKAQDLVHVQFD